MKPADQLNYRRALSVRARGVAATRGMEGRVGFWTVGAQDYRTLMWLANGSFKVAYAFESICHVTDPAALVAAMYRVVEPGGWLIVRDWSARPWGPYQSTGQVAHFLDPVCENIRLAELRTVDRHAELIEQAGFEVHRAVDVFAGRKCWGATPAEDRDKWLGYTGPEQDLFRQAKQVLDDARAAGVFTVCEILARRPVG